MTGPPLNSYDAAPIVCERAAIVNSDSKLRRVLVSGLGEGLQTGDDRAGVGRDGLPKLLPAACLALDSVVTAYQQGH